MLLDSTTPRYIRLYKAQCRVSQVRIGTTTTARMEHDFTSTGSRDVLPTSRNASRASPSPSPVGNVQDDRRSKSAGHHQNRNGHPRPGPRNRMWRCLLHNNSRLPLLGTAPLPHRSCPCHSRTPPPPPPRFPLLLPSFYLFPLGLGDPQTSWNEQTNKHTHAREQTNKK